MIRINELPLLGFLLFTLIYATVGDPNNEIWSGCYFIVNYLTLLFLFKQHRSKVIRLTGISLSISILMFVVAKFFLSMTIERWYTIIPFTICLIALIKLESNALRNRKNF